MNFGGPVWHASVIKLGSRRTPERVLRPVAYRHLASVGDPRLGEWCEYSGFAFHVRRRLSAAEEASVGPAIDLRGTAHARQRLTDVFWALPFQVRKSAWAEIGMPENPVDGAGRIG